MSLHGKHILLAVCGGIAAYKSCELVRLLVKEGADVEVMMTEAATQFVTPLTFETLSGHPASVKMWDEERTLPHISLRQNKDLIVVVPATANMLAKIANGIADDLVSSTLLARDCPLMVCPAMNVRMWMNPATQRNVLRLAEDGILLSGPEAGVQACGDVGAGRLRDPQKILEDIISFFSPSFLKGTKVLMTAGATFEAFDPVRGITNGSSGLQAACIARSLVRAGAQVRVVSGLVSAAFPEKAEIIHVTSAQEMFEAVQTELKEQKPDVFIAVAAVGDWRPAAYSSTKLKKEDGVEELSVKLVKNPDILSFVGHSGICRLVVGFAAETENLEENARTKLARKNADLIVVNPASAIGSERNRAAFITENSFLPFEESSKQELADALVQTIASRLNQEQSEL